MEKLNLNKENENKKLHRTVFERFLETQTGASIHTSELYSKIICYINGLIENPDQVFSKKILHNYYIQKENGEERLYRKIGKKNLQVVNVDNIFDILDSYHGQKHFKLSQMYRKIVEIYYGIPRMVIDNFIRLCPVCKHQSNFMDLVELSFLNMEKYQTKSLYKWIAIANEKSTNYRIMWPMKEKCDTEISQGLEYYLFTFFGIPKYLEIENNGELSHKLIRQLIDDWDAKCYIVNKFIKNNDFLIQNLIELVIKEYKDREWIEVLPDIMRNVNSYFGLEIKEINENRKSNHDEPMFFDDIKNAIEINSNNENFECSFKQPSSVLKSIGNISKKMKL